MMYQRAILLVLLYLMPAIALLSERKQPLYNRGENRVDAKKKYRKNDGHDENHDRRLHGFSSRGPYYLADFGPHLTDEFAGACFCHIISSCSIPKIAAIAPTGGVESDIGSDFGKTRPLTRDSV